MDDLNSYRYCGGRQSLLAVYVVRYLSAVISEVSGKYKMMCKSVQVDKHNNNRVHMASNDPSSAVLFWSTIISSYVPAPANLHFPPDQDLRMPRILFYIFMADHLNDPMMMSTAH